MTTERRREPTVRMIALLQAAANGDSNRRIAHAYGMTEEAVRSDLSRLYLMIGACNRAHAVAIGIRTGRIK